MNASGLWKWQGDRLYTVTQLKETRHGGSVVTIKSVDEKPITKMIGQSFRMISVLPRGLIGSVYTDPTYTIVTRSAMQCRMVVREK